MRVISVSLQNFASYKSLNFNFLEQGLTLIQGATGSGKSTLCDAIPWTVFGVTAKNGAVTEVLSWPGDKITKSAVHLEVRDTAMVIKRSRGPKPKDNDLYYMEIGGSIVRGKDLIDTQKLINSALGLDADLYLAGSYYHEFSQTAQFFTTTAKNRRSICEQIVDLTLAKTLQTKLSDKYKNTKNQITKLQAQSDTLMAAIKSLTWVQQSETLKASNWEATTVQQKRDVAAHYDRFEKNRKHTVSKKCNSCGTMLEHPREVVDESENPYTARLAELEVAVNPHTGGVKDYSDEINAKQQEFNDKAAEIEANQHTSDDIELLQQVVADFRSASITRTIQQIEAKTNQLLTDHFDAEIRVEFTVEDNDKLDVTIQKDGNTCAYTQLSKGQRCLLKLAFGVAVMQEVANHHGIKFHQVFFDESLDGLDDQMKSKALRLFETIAQEYGSVFLVEHSTELKALINSSYHVSLTNEGSKIEKA